MTTAPIRKPVLRKPPAKRLFSGMAGSPLARIEENAHLSTQAPPPAVAVLEPEHPPVLMESIPKKPGPKPKYGRAMTVAERQTESRANRKQKQQDAERRKLIAELIRIYRRQQGDVVFDSKRPHLVQDRKAAKHRQERSYLEQLMTLAIGDLRLALEAQKQTPDTHGRLSDERSGEGTRAMGQSEIERLIAAKQHDSSLFEDEDQDPSMAGGFRVEPAGSGADQFEAQDSMADSADVRTGSAKPGREPTASEKWIQKAIEGIVAKMNFEPDGSQCPFCLEVFLTSDSVEHHLDGQYATGWKDLERHLAYEDAIAAMNSRLSMPGGGVSTLAEPRSVPYIHYKGINREIDSVRKLARKKPKKAA